MAESHEVQFQPVNNQLEPAVIEKVNKAAHAYEYAPTSELKITSPLAGDSRLPRLWAQTVF
jgi:hypothetical protein